MKKSKIVLYISIFLCGGIVSGGIVIYLATNALVSIFTADMLGADKYPMTHVLEMIYDYNTAETYWPFLRYNQQFIQRKNDLEKILRMLQSKPAVTIFFKVPLNTKDITEVVKEVQAIHGVTKVTYISQEKALEIYKQENKNDKLLLDLVTSNILPASLEVNVSDQTAKTTIKNLVRNKPNVSEVIESPDY